jgi:hypothetical protein
MQSINDFKKMFYLEIIKIWEEELVNYQKDDRFKAEVEAAKAIVKELRLLIPPTPPELKNAFLVSEGPLLSQISEVAGGRCGVCGKMVCPLCVRPLYYEVHDNGDTYAACVWYSCEYGPGSSKINNAT